MWKLFATGLLLTVGVCQPLAAQQAPAADPALDKQLQTTLDVWEAVLPTAETVYVEFQATRKYNATSGLTKTYKGQAKFMRLPGCLIGAMVYLGELDSAGQPLPDKYELIICTGREIYIVDPKTREVLYQEISAGKGGQVADQGPLSFLLGMKKPVALNRYQMKVQKMEGLYTHLGIWPKFARDAQEFQYAELAICNQTIQGKTTQIPAYMPRRFFWIEPNKNTNTWDIIVLRHNAPDKVKRTDFQRPQLAGDWKWKKIEPVPPPPAGGTPGQN